MKLFGYFDRAASSAVTVEQPDVEVRDLDPVDAGQLALEHAALVLVEARLPRVDGLGVANVGREIDSACSMCSDSSRTKHMYSCP